MKKIALVLLVTALSTTGASTQPEDVVQDATAIHALGLRARLYPEERDPAVQRLAKSIAVLSASDKARLRELQQDFQEALLLVCDPEIYETLSTGTIEAVDTAIEGVVTMDDIKRDTEWEPLIYVYGFFNRDANAGEIVRIQDQWVSIPADEREPYYPTYPHAIDAVTKPLSMGPLFDPQETTQALNVATLLLRAMLLQPPLPGRGFHVPSHAALVIGPLYERWENDVRLGVQVKQHLGTRDELEALMAGQLVGAQPDLANLDDDAFGFYAYTGRYLANGLARLDARVAVPALRQSLEIYRAHEAPETTIAYTERALAVLGDADARAQLETALTAGEDDALLTVVWICRNAQGEGRAYGCALLGEQMSVPADEALDAWFRRELEKAEGQQ
ncbi:MAG: hypothetical protein AMXMBFR82_29150 [Candidatus Hydrogenedentota bacterium]